MTKAITFFTTAILLACVVQAQKVKEKEVLGTWKLIINIEEKMDKEAEEADTFLEEVLIKSVSGLVDGILDDIEIYFEFKKNNKLVLTVNAYDETEVEKGTWFINKNGYLVIEDIDSDDNEINIGSSNDEWKLIDGILVNADEDEEDRTVYMAKVD